MKKSLLLIITNISLFFSAFCQIQKGNDIVGQDAEYQNFYRNQLSMPTKDILAVGTINGGNTGLDGDTKIFQFNGTDWVIKGAPIIPTTDDNSGLSLSMPDENTIAIGSVFGDPTPVTRVFNWDGTNWVQKGSNIYSTLNALSPYAVSMPDVNTLAIGYPRATGILDFQGLVRIYNWNGSDWVQKGQDIYGEYSFDESGGSVSMSDPNTIAIGSQYNDDGGNNAGHTRVYKYKSGMGVWEQKGSDIDGSTSDENTGYSVCMFDQDNISIGKNIKNYVWSGTDWVQKGNSLGGEFVSMPSENTMAVSYNNNNGETKLYKWDGASWIQFGSTIIGKTGEDYLGNSISMPDNFTVSISSPTFESANGTGVVRVFEVCSTSVPTGDAAQIFCDAATISDLSATGTGIKWYDASTDGNLLSGTDALTNGSTYFASQTDNGCESQTRLAVAVTINSTSAPTGDAAQIFCDAATISDLAATGTGIKWYDASTDGNLLSGTDALTNGSTYYASQTDNGCESQTRLEVTVTITPYPIKTVTISGNTITSDETGATYQWLDCDNGNAEISGATSQSYEPGVSGNFAVEVTKDGCTSTSDCQSLTFVGLEKNTQNNFSVYPNPTKNTLIIHLSQLANSGYIITDQLGKVVMEGNISSQKQDIDVSDLAKGVYVITVGEVNQKFIKE